MYYVKVTIGVLFGILVFAFLDYVVPSQKVVRITNVYNQLTALGGNSIFYASPDTGTVQAADGRRDIRFIATVKPNGSPYVYRNEDTGWIWPPYFKYDSANLHAVASDQVSNSADPKWVNVTSYGWRIAWATIYPNAVGITPVAGPADRPTNWPALIVLSVLGVLLLLFWRMWAQFTQRTIQSAVDRVGDTWDRVEDRADAARDRVVADASAARGRFTRWMDTWRGKPRP